MKIIKHGNMKPRIFTCIVCGCEFIAEVNEYRTTKIYIDDPWYSSYCPECNSETIDSKPLEEEKNE